MMSSIALPACRHATVGEDNNEPEDRDYQTGILKEATFSDF